MSVDYTGIAAEVAVAFQEVRQGSVTLTRVTPGTPNPATPWVPVPSTSVTYALDAITKSVEDKFVDGTTILATDTQIKTGSKMVRTHVNGAPAGPEVVDTSIAPGDVIAIDGQAVQVVKEMRFPKAGPAILWTLIVRG